MKKSPRPESALIRHDYRRAVYRAMLSVMPPEDVIEYFELESLVIEGRSLEGKEKFDLLWAEKARITVDYDYRLDNRFERFILSKQGNLAALLQKILWLQNNSTHIPGKVLLTWFFPKLESLSNAIDTRDMVFAMITIFTENWLPNHFHRRLKWWQDGEWTHSVMIYFADPVIPGLLEFDFELIAGPQVLNSPVMFGLPPFEGFGMIADCRHPEAVVWVEEDAPVCHGDEVSIRGEVHGRRRSFLEFCLEREIDVSRYNLADVDIHLFEKDYYCPIRKRVVLSAGCAYGAPVFLHWVKHKPLRDTRRGGLGLFVADLVREETLQDADLERKHLALLALLSRDPVFEYHAADESFSLNGRFFTKGVPAIILKHLLEAHLKGHKSEFEYRDLKRIFEITQGQKNPNFEVRFYRLVEKLEAESPALRIEKTGRGRFRLKVTGRFRYLDLERSHAWAGEAGEA